MKTKRNMKFITLMLSCLLIIGAAVGITVAAEGSNSPTVEIAYKNLSYEGAPQLVYYVDAKNISEGQTVKVLFFNTKPSTVTLENASLAVTSVGKLTVGESEYDAFLSKEIAPKEMRKTIYAAAAVVNETGELVSASPVVLYSVYDYCMDRFDMNSTDEQVSLYKALLNFGASVQEVLIESNPENINIDSLGGWIDAYYDVTYTQSAWVAGEKKVTESSNTIRPTEEFTVADTYEGKYLANCEDKDGNPIALTDGKIVVSTLKPGTITINANYKSKAGGEEPYFYISKFDTTGIGFDYEGTDIDSSGVSTGGSSALSLTDGKLYVDVHGGSEHSINWTPMQTLTNSFVFETDFMVESGTATDGFVRFGFHNNQTNSRPMLFYITPNGLALNGNGATTYNYGEWLHIKIVAAGAYYSVYINGVLQYTTDDGMQDIVPVVGYMTISRGVSTAKIFFDNTYFGNP